MMEAYSSDSIVGIFSQEYLHLGSGNLDRSPQTNWRTYEGQTTEAAGLLKLAPGQPNSLQTDAEKCVFIHRETGQLNNLPCTTQVLNFICEKHPDYPPVCTKEESNESSTISSQIPTSTSIYL
ncbi:uncharacterized protein LOC142984421 [Anticarsia gemmatalis]|uniref:uncharacterized protein LOC142984421 n=1 Tax=Anticarsia gemmatalis TaxID=129554 RepID=UPI003F75A882